MSNVLAPPNRDDYPTEGAWAFAASVYGLLTGQSSWGVPIDHVGADDDSNYALTVQNQGTGGHINVPGLFLVDNSGVSIGSMSITNLTVTGLAALNDLDVSGSADFVDIDVSNGAVINSAIISGSGMGLTVSHNALVNGTATLGALAVSTTAAVQGNTTLGDADDDTLTVIGVSTFRNAADSATQLFVDAANSRVIVGSETALTSATDDRFTVAGGTAYFAGNSGPAIGIRYNASQTVGWLIGVDGSGANKDLLLLDDGGSEIVRIGDASSAQQMRVQGNFLGNTGTFDWQNSGNSRLKINATGVGLFGADPIARPTVVGSKGGNVALANLLTALGGTGLGLVTDSTT